MNSMKETKNISRQLYIEWMPQILYNHHQSGPAGTVLAGPPYRDPFNYVFDPLVVTSLDAVGAAMINSYFNADPGQSFFVDAFDLTSVAPPGAPNITNLGLSIGQQPIEQIPYA